MRGANMKILQHMFQLLTMKIMHSKNRLLVNANQRGKTNDELSRRSFTLKKRKFKLMEERLMEKSQADEDEDEDYTFLISLSSSIKKKKLDDTQTLELRMKFLSRVTKRIQISNDLSLPFNSVLTASHISCPQTSSQRATNLHSTHSRDSDTSTHTMKMSFISSANLLPRQFQVQFLKLLKGYPYCIRRMVYQFHLHS